MARMSVDARRAQLLDVGRELFARSAYDDVSTDVIRDAAGVSIGLVYHHFGSKRGFYHATVSSVATALLTVTEPDSDDLREALVGSLDAFLQYIHDNARIYRALLRGGVGSDDTAHAIVEEVRRASVRRVLERWPGPVDGLLRMRLYGWVGFVECVALDWLDQLDAGEAVDAEVVRDLLIDALLRVLA